MTDRQTFVEQALTLYRAARDTPGRTRPADRRVAETFFDHGVTLKLLSNAILLTTVRRHCRHPDLPPLQPIHSLRYFQPVIAELLDDPPIPEYFAYLEDRLRRLDAAEATRTSANSPPNTP
jgi:hypothetical protein